MKKSIYIFCTLMFVVVISKAQSSISWGTDVDIASSASGNEHPRIVVNRSGNPLVIWHHVSRVMFSRWNGTAFSTPVILNPGNISVAGASWMGPDIVSHGDTVYVVFKQTPEASDTCHIFCVHSYNGGITFSAPARVDYINNNLSRFPAVTTDDAGNPIIGFMKFDSVFLNSSWAVVKSADFGNTFSTDVKASGWNGNDSVCECCPGSVACKGNTVAMVYRDNANNIRDTWTGISTTNATSFSGGMNVDQHNWYLPACPASGPDGVIIGDTLYSVFMNGASGTDRVYLGASSISNMSALTSQALTKNIPGLSSQNYPRIATDGCALAAVWQQVVSGNDQCLLCFTNNSINRFPVAYDTVALNNITNADVAISKGNVFVIWEDDNSGTVKYRNGTFSSTTGMQENSSHNSFSVYPNPTSGVFNVQMSKSENAEIKIYDVLGEFVYHSTTQQLNNSTIDLSAGKNGIYFLQLKTSEGVATKKLVVSR